MKKGISVLIVDDSAVFRSQTRAALQSLGVVKSIESASNGRMAIEKLKASNFDLMILDLEMPEMDGLATLRELLHQNLNVKTLLFSSSTSRGAKVTMEGLGLGAFDFATKPTANDGLVSPDQLILQALRPKIEALFAPETFIEPVPFDRSAIRPGLENFQPECVVIGSSTGGPAALEQIFRDFVKPPCYPIFIAQHMPPIFTTTFAERLAKVSGLNIREARHGEQVRAGHVYVAPGDYHMEIGRDSGNLCIRLHQGPQEHFVRPAVDPLFRSASALYGRDCLGVVLTGMGQDGLLGCETILQNGGRVVIQDQASCVVYGMPGAVHRANSYNAIMTPSEIKNYLRQVGSYPLSAINRGSA